MTRLCLLGTVLDSVRISCIFTSSSSAVSQTFTYQRDCKSEVLLSETDVLCSVQRSETEFLLSSDGQSKGYGFASFETADALSAAVSQPVFCLL